MRLKAGVLIIGSLLWDNNQGEHINYRLNWRRKKLILKQKIYVQAPIRYGRLSGNKGNRNYTMVLSKECESEENNGLAYIIPLKQQVIRSHRGIEYNGRHLSKAEGKRDRKLCKGNNDKWCTIGLLFNPELRKGIKSEIIERWSELLKNDGGLNDHNEYCVQGEDSVLSSEGEILINWIKSQKANYQKRVDDFDFLFVTCTKAKPRENYPNIDELAGKSLKDEREYFFKNMRYGIRTWQDREIISAQNKAESGHATV